MTSTTWDMCSDVIKQQEQMSENDGEHPILGMTCGIYERQFIHDCETEDVSSLNLECVDVWARRMGLEVVEKDRGSAREIFIMVTRD